MGSRKYADPKPVLGKQILDCRAIYHYYRHIELAQKAYTNARETTTKRIYITPGKVQWENKKLP
jgi:hypothetical protein